jgi:hypothetical protein
VRSIDRRHPRATDQEGPTSGDLRALQALVAEAESAGSVTRADSEVLLQWADETGVTNMHGLDVPHLRDTPWRDIPHIKIFGVHRPVVG